MLWWHKQWHHRPCSTCVETAFWEHVRVKIQTLRATPVDLLNPPYLQVLHGMVQLVKVGRNWFFWLPCLMLEWFPPILICSTISIFLTYCRPHFFIFFVLHEMLLLMCYFLPVIFWMHFLSPFLGSIYTVWTESLHIVMKLCALKDCSDYFLTNILV